MIGGYRVSDLNIYILTQAHNMFKVEIEKLDYILSKRATRPHIYDSTSANACVRIYV
jgi:hypothetical protein